MINEIALEKFRFGLQQAISEEIFLNDLSVDVKWVHRQVIATIRFSILGQHAERKEIQYPANWRESVKDRFAPDWIKRRWPVRYVKHTFEVKILYPDIAIPSGQHHVMYAEYKANGFYYPGMQADDIVQ